MKTGFQLEIRTPEKKVYSGAITALTARAIDGELGILAGHIPLATALAAGRVSYLAENGEQGGVDCQGGFLFIDNGAATVLL
ncbi:MAG: F0F1 ATP synthase subunit epsilon [Candidatus Margulisiibacteriota bacterium]